MSAQNREVQLLLEAFGKEKTSHAALFMREFIDEKIAVHHFLCWLYLHGTEWRINLTEPYHHAKTMAIAQPDLAMIADTVGYNRIGVKIKELQKVYPRGFNRNNGDGKIPSK